MADLHPAENRGYREAYAFARQVAEHWEGLARRLPSGSSGPFMRGADMARELITELEPLTGSFDLHGRPAAQGLGSSLGRVRGVVRDRFLETDRAARMAVLELGYLTVLMGYLAAVAETQGDELRRDFCDRWERKLKRVENAARRAAVELGTDPDRAVEPYDTSPVGRAAHSVGYAVGAVGEFVDRQAARGRW